VLRVRARRPAAWAWVSRHRGHTYERRGCQGIEDVHVGVEGVGVGAKGKGKGEVDVEHDGERQEAISKGEVANGGTHT
jgi:hypothetical protein